MIPPTRITRKLFEIVKNLKIQTKESQKIPVKIKALLFLDLTAKRQDSIEKMIVPSDETYTATRGCIDPFDHIIEFMLFTRPLFSTQSDRSQSPKT